MAHMQGAFVFLGGKIDLLHWLAVRSSFWFSEIDLVEILLVAFAQLNIYIFFVDLSWVKVGTSSSAPYLNELNFKIGFSWKCLECYIFLNSSPTNRGHLNLKDLTSWKIKPLSYLNSRKMKTYARDGK